MPLVPPARTAVRGTVASGRGPGHLPSRGCLGASGRLAVTLNEVGIWTQRKKKTQHPLVGARRAQARRIKMVGVSVLKQHAVGPVTVARYAKSLVLVKQWLGISNIEWVEQQNDREWMQEQIVEYLDYLYLVEERNVGEGTAFVAALGYHIPWMYRGCSMGRLPQVSLALQGWAKLDPVRQRMPWLLPLLSAVTNWMILQGRLVWAILTLVTADSYLRPGEMMGLHRESVIPPQPKVGLAYRHVALLVHPYSHGRSSKVFEFDDSVLLDSVGREWLGQVLLQLRARRSPGSALAPGSAVEWLRLFQQAAKHLQVEPASLYILRHSGPSDDFLCRRRSLEQAILSVLEGRRPPLVFSPPNILPLGVRRP